MKKFLVAILVFAMVLSLAATLSSCKKDEEEPSKEVSAEESKPEPSKPEVSEQQPEEPSQAEEPSEEPSQAEEPSEEPSQAEEPSEEPSQAEEPSEEPSQAEEPPVEPSQAEPPSEAPPSVAYKTSPAGTNYALNATYSTTRDGEYEPTRVYLSYDKGKYDYADIDPDNPEHQFYKLNDGVVGDIAAYEGTGEGYYSDAASLPGTTVQYVGTDSAFEFKFDLGDHYGDIKSLKFRNVRHGTPNGNNRGFEVKLVQASDDGVAWHRVKGELTSVQIAGAPEIESMMEEGAKNVEHFDFTYTFDEPVQAKNLKIVLSDDGGYVMQLEEIEIHN